LSRSYIVYALLQNPARFRSIAIKKIRKTALSVGGYGSGCVAAALADARSGTAHLAQPGSGEDGEPLAGSSPGQRGLFSPWLRTWGTCLRGQFSKEHEAVSELVSARLAAPRAKPLGGRLWLAIPSAPLGGVTAPSRRGGLGSGPSSILDRGAGRPAAAGPLRVLSMQPTGARLPLAACVRAGWEPRNRKNRAPLRARLHGAISHQRLQPHMV